MEGKYESVEEAVTTIKFWLQQMASSINTVKVLSSHDKLQQVASSINKVKVLSSHDARILSYSDFPCVMGRQRQTRMIIWRNPISSRGKLNVDGCSFGNPSLSGCRGVIRDEFGKVMASFASQLGKTTNTEAELRAIIEGLKVCQQLGACAVEIECDYLIIVNWLKIRKCTVWYLWDFWEELLGLIQLFEVHVMHQYREGNQVADALAKLGAKGHT
ncbi:unnamed protein product [Fraxinus pennsylvanica]|uniref:RNase H type-1 domain-containing protein n=1 Tax=Fraxinus pennsylvanica TaxID=56036 RepID=A0AAD1YUC2_9LAMI|nr:unnamed protein product [Fraxinus pennsylvanica]